MDGSGDQILSRQVHCGLSRPLPLAVLLLLSLEPVGASVTNGMYNLGQWFCNGPDLSGYIYSFAEAPEACINNLECGGITCSVSRGSGNDGLCKLKGNVTNEDTGDSRFYCDVTCAHRYDAVCAPSPPPPTPPPLPQLF